MIDPIWENKYKSGFEQRYPWDSVVSFVFRYSPKDKKKSDTEIMEVGFGSGSNLLFAAKEGFSVSGIEASATAVNLAQARFSAENLLGDLRQGDFVNLPFDSNIFDLVFDRAALTHNGKNDQVKAINEIRRVLKVGGVFYYNSYADSHSSNFSGNREKNGIRNNINSGTLTNVGQVYFSSKNDIDDLFSEGWKVIKITRKELTEMLTPEMNIHSEWLIVAEKVK